MATEALLAACPTLSEVFPSLSAAQKDALQQIVSSYPSTDAPTKFFGVWDTARQTDTDLTPQVCVERAQQFFDTVIDFNKSYAGGIRSYIAKALVLLEQSRSQ